MYYFFHIRLGIFFCSALTLFSRIYSTSRSVRRNVYSPRTGSYICIYVLYTTDCLLWFASKWATARARQTKLLNLTHIYLRGATPKRLLAFYHTYKIYTAHWVRVVKGVERARVKCALLNVYNAPRAGSTHAQKHTCVLYAYYIPRSFVKELFFIQCCAITIYIYF